MSPTINITALQKAAETYDTRLRLLPFAVLAQTLNVLSIHLQEVTHKHKIVQFQRKAGLAKPYIVNGENSVSGDVGKVIERELEVKPCFAALRDHIMNYKTKSITGIVTKVDNQDKNHPAEKLILIEKVKTIAEDILDAVFFAERDESDPSPQGMLDGFYTLIAKEIASGEVSTAKGNLRNTGAIAAPVDSNDTEAYDKLVDWIRGASPYLRKNGVIYISQSAMFYAMDALGNKINAKNAFEFDVFTKHLRGVCEAPRLELMRNPIIGSGSQLLYTVKENLNLGMNTKSDVEFVSVRKPYEDPNQIQFWTQWELGSRINSIHHKEFMVNEQTNTGDPLSGDYS